MDLKATIAIILKDLEEARDILDDLKNYPEVPAIQVELAKAKCRSAGEVIKVLGETIVEHDTQAVLPQAQEPEYDDNELSEDAFALDEEDSPEDIDDRETDFATEIIDEVVQAHEDRADDNTSAKEGKILADKFSKQASINEQLSGKRHEDDSAELTKLKPISDIKTAIGVNEKFMFIRELFKGDQELYNSTLDKLNISSNINDAFDTLSGIAPGSGSSEAFEMLIELVKRKLSSK